MKGFVVSVILAAAFTWVITAINGSVKSTEHQNVYYNVGRVVSLGQCKDGTCSYGYTDMNNELKYATLDRPVSLGQLVYQECWYEEAQGNQCYVDYTPSKN